MIKKILESEAITQNTYLSGVIYMDIESKGIDMDMTKEVNFMMLFFVEEHIQKMVINLKRLYNSIESSEKYYEDERWD